MDGGCISRALSTKNCMKKTSEISQAIEYVTRASERTKNAHVRYALNESLDALHESLLQDDTDLCLTVALEELHTAARLLKQEC